MSEKQVTISLKSLLVPSKSIETEFPGLSGFVVNLSFLSRETLQSIRKKSTKIMYKNRQPVEEVNDDLFLQLYVNAAIKGWKGLKLSYVEQLAPVELGAEDANAELPFTEENALMLMKASTDFDSWISSQVTDLGNFQSNSKSK